VIHAHHFLSYHPEQIYYVKLNKESHVLSLIGRFIPSSHQALKVCSVPEAEVNTGILNDRYGES